MVWDYKPHGRSLKLLKATHHVRCYEVTTAPFQALGSGQAVLAPFSPIVAQRINRDNKMGFQLATVLSKQPRPIPPES